MTKLLLDFPWELSSVLDSGSELPKVLLEFKRLIARTGLDLVPFIEDEERASFWNQVNARRKGPEFAALVEFVEHCKRNTVGSCVARPDPEPPRLRDSWKRALREEMRDSTNWRNPQIIVTKQRRPEWQPLHEYEVDIHCEQCGDEPASGQHKRNLVVLEDYDSHRFATPDLDPRDLRWFHPPIANRPRQHPALLPKPPLPNGTNLGNLRDNLRTCRDRGWIIDGNYYFIPPVDFDPLNIDKEAWRKGRAFHYETAPESGKSGPVDYNGIVWSWDMEERHWDVQTKPRYLRISHTGKKLPDH